jgi:hypothetical protein
MRPLRQTRRTQGFRVIDNGNGFEHRNSGKFQSGIQRPGKSRICLTADTRTH